MPGSGSPLNRSIGLPGVIRFVIAITAVIAIGAAIDTEHWGLAVIGLVFLAVAIVLGYRATRARRPDGAKHS